MMDLTCTECERLWEAYDSAALAVLIVEHKSATETGLAVIVRKASDRCQEARKAVEDHEATHMIYAAAASGAS
jgi:hypothetical protein